MDDTLIERLEAASGPDRELDCLIAVAVNADSLPGAYKEMSDDPGVVEAGMVRHFYNDSKSLQQARRYTASLDAAMTLVPEGCQWRVDSHYNMAGVFEYYTDPQEGPSMNEYNGEGHNLALALCIVALRAQAGEKS